jgi:exodeoxyribonuclease VII large subunit
MTSSDSLVKRRQRPQLDLFGEVASSLEGEVSLAEEAEERPEEVLREAEADETQASAEEAILAAALARRERGGPPTPPLSPAPPTATERAPVARERPVLGVAELDRLAQRLLERATTGVLVRGEVSGLSRSGAGHVYFTLKDERFDACVECMMYRTAPLRARRQLCEGERVVVSGRLTIYAARGRMQLVVEDVLQTARGALLEKLERLKATLAAEGLFDAARKKELPRDARFIAVLTSRGGAAIHDFVRVAHRRGAARIVLVDTPVQGAGAAGRIALAIARADRLGAEVLVVTRGGGSAEDLAAYNDEVVVRAIAGAKTPVLSAVGHEIDTTLADLVADARAATPSQAAELLVPDDRSRRDALAQLRQRLVRAVQHGLERRTGAVRHLRSRLGEPRRTLLEHAQHLDDLIARLERAARRRLRRDALAIEAQRWRLERQHPRRVLTDARAAIVPQLPTLERCMRRELERHREGLVGERRLAGLIERRLTRARRSLEGAAARLDALSPLSVLARGYAIVTHDGHVLSDASETTIGERVEIRLGRGRLTAQIEARHEPDPVLEPSDPPDPPSDPTAE